MPQLPIKAAFLDRDGVINEDYSYVYRKEDFHFLPGVFDACRMIRDKGYELIIATNQSGIGRGKYTVEEFESLCAWMQEVFAKEGCPFLAVYFCPHHPEEALGQYLQKCSCRKPEPGMILSAAEELNVDLKNSVLIGDKLSDMKAGQAAGIHKCFLVSGNPSESKAYKTFPSLLDVARFL